MPDPEYISMTDAGRRKGVTRQSVANSIACGTLTVQEIAGRRLVVVDDKFSAWLDRKWDWARKTPVD